MILLMPTTPIPIPFRRSHRRSVPLSSRSWQLSRVAFYNALDDAGLDAAAHEVQDLCNGHPQGHHRSKATIRFSADNALLTSRKEAKQKNADSTNRRFTSKATC